MRCLLSLISWAYNSNNNPLSWPVLAWKLVDLDQERVFLIRNEFSKYWNPLKLLFHANSFTQWNDCRRCFFSNGAHQQNLVYIDNGAQDFRIVAASLEKWQLLWHTIHEISRSFVITNDVKSAAMRDWKIVPRRHFDWLPVAKHVAGFLCRTAVLLPDTILIFIISLYPVQKAIAITG